MRKNLSFESIYEEMYPIHPNVSEERARRIYNFLLTEPSSVQLQNFYRSINNDEFIFALHLEEIFRRDCIYVLWNALGGCE